MASAATSSTSLSSVTVSFAEATKTSVKKPKYHSGTIGLAAARALSAGAVYKTEKGEKHSPIKVDTKKTDNSLEDVQSPKAASVNK